MVTNQAYLVGTVPGGHPEDSGGEGSAPANQVRRQDLSQVCRPGENIRRL